MAGEVVCLGRLLGVGESGHCAQQKANFTISRGNFDPKVPSKRPAGWELVRTQRVQMKELEDRMNRVSENDITKKRAHREANVSNLLFKFMKQVYN